MLHRYLRNARKLASPLVNLRWRGKHPQDPPMQLKIWYKVVNFEPRTLVLKPIVDESPINNNTNIKFFVAAPEKIMRK